MINFHILSYSLKNGKKKKLLYTLDSSVSISAQYTKCKVLDNVTRFMKFDFITLVFINDYQRSF